MNRTPAPGSTVLVYGCSRSGVAAAGLLRAKGAEVIVLDDVPRERLGRAPATVEAVGATCLCGPQPEGAIPQADLLVLSPGIPATHPVIARLAQAGTAIVGEVAFASWYCPAPMLVVTGTNGKSTTATLLHHMLGRAGVRSVLAGNVGTAFSGIVQDVDKDQVVVLEVSSYQLEHAAGFAPRVGAILNLTPDHLDRYATFDDYVAAKRGLWALLADDGVAVANADDPRVVQEAASLGTPITWFGFAASEQPACTVDAEYLVWRRGGFQEPLLPVDDIPLLGRHNVSNVLAAYACALEVCDDTAGLAEGVRTFTPVEHRLEPVREVGGVLYINDSKATNVMATVTALAAMTRPTVLLLGGRGKGTGYQDLRAGIADRVRHLVVYGEDAEAVLADVGDVAPVTEAHAFDEAVAAATRAAEPGDVVLLSPACASFDMFPNFEERGWAFKRLVEGV